jgi:hypothetical protein
MTFDEIFQNYVAQGFTKPIAGISGIETLMPTTATVAPITPIQQPQDTGGGSDNDFSNVPDTTTNLGITSLSDAIQGLVDLYSQLPTPMNLAIKGFQNFQNPYTDIMGNINQQTQDAINRDIAREMQESNRENKTGGYQAGYSSDFMDGPSGAGYGMGAGDKGGSDTMGSF